MESLAARAERAHHAMDEEPMEDDPEQRKVLVECATLLMRGKDASDEFRTQTADLRSRSQGIRLRLMEEMDKANQSCLRLNGDDPKYIRINRSSSVGSIKLEDITAALSGVTNQDLETTLTVLETRERRRRVADREAITPLKVLVQCVYDRIRDAKKSDKRSVAFNQSPEKGKKEEDIAMAPDEIQKLCNDLRQTQEDLRALSDARKQQEAEAKARLRELEEQAQQILMDRRRPEEDVETMTRGNFKLRCKRSVRLPAPKLTDIRQQVLPKALEKFEENLQTLPSVLSLLSSPASLRQVVEAVKLVLEDREPVVSTKLALDKVAGRLVSVEE